MFNVNQDKARVGLKKTTYIRYSIHKFYYSLEDFIASQVASIPVIKIKETYRDLHFKGFECVQKGVA